MWDCPLQKHAIFFPAVQKASRLQDLCSLFYWLNYNISLTVWLLLKIVPRVLFPSFSPVTKQTASKHWSSLRWATSDVSWYVKPPSYRYLPLPTMQKRNNQYHRKLSYDTTQLSCGHHIVWVRQDLFFVPEEIENNYPFPSGVLSLSPPLFHLRQGTCADCVHFILPTSKKGDLQSQSGITEPKKEPIPRSYEKHTPENHGYHWAVSYWEKRGCAGDFWRQMLDSK